MVCQYKNVDNLEIFIDSNITSYNKTSECSNLSILSAILEQYIC